MDQYYLQDSRNYVGNDVLWWKKGGAGYTTDLREAEVYSKDAAVRKHECRESDIPWPKDYIDARTRPAVDFQYIKRDEALAGTGITLKKPQKLRKDVSMCIGCGRFMSDKQRYTSNCPHCGADNHP
ncbi:MAG: hypothetical protein B7Y56_03255 [Gallionellales bacterium 35-53-114]|jgi:rubrerythrin|nr:MAG: hypothetical protein B7Y56_03255 [Gallionellales bacterium 35-53-114]OYZ65123.1 MAG: hypothetical protein B7Y04_00415 [Gallionellales bacterium 24-53-125]OZB08031.1 MAG: hypothetical protein B7X61_10865 [Gallionellales bacterium 39-52-133]HQS59933.1 hypothetical protein [Gallionellaceae bacterium]HQS76685.1 hypothetical protein [Gallionellaceae bacterium]